MHEHQLSELAQMSSKNMNEQEVLAQNRAKLVCDQILSQIQVQIQEPMTRFERKMHCNGDYDDVQDSMTRKCESTVFANQSKDANNSE